MNEMSSGELREKYQKFFMGKGHARIPSGPLVPENDPSVLFTTAGMHPLVPFLKGQEHLKGKRLTNVQICLRTTDIDAVGDGTHNTVFEMLGNWSLGDYFKQESIAYSWEFLTSDAWLGFDKEKLAVSVFGGDESRAKDEESARYWRDAGMPTERIAYLDIQENWWPAGGQAEGPQGPDTEIFYWTGEEEPPQVFDPTDDRWVEIWNNVFMQYDRDEEGNFSDLAQQNVDTGMGLERVVMVLNGLNNVYEIDSYRALMDMIRNLSARTDKKQSRILADHIKAATFILGDGGGVTPGNTEQGYVLRRLIRRAVRAAGQLEIDDASRVLKEGAVMMIDEFANAYPTLADNRSLVLDELGKEAEKFKETLAEGLKHFEALLNQSMAGDTIDGNSAFKLYETYGWPIELTQEMAAEHKLAVDMGGFEKAVKRHQNISRKGADKKFKGGLADHSDESIKLHTATHLLHQALRDILGDGVLQKGSNITPERLRFDFSYSRKLTADQLKQVEDMVNYQIDRNLAVTKQAASVAEAKEMGARGLFEDKYGDKVNVYSIGEYSREICGGPHAAATKELGKFKITREESAGAGIRRIKAVLKPV